MFVSRLYPRLLCKEKNVIKEQQGLLGLLGLLDLMEYYCSIYNYYFVFV